MKITEVGVDAVPGNSNLRARMSFVLDHSFAIHGIKLIEANGKRFLSFPRRQEEMSCETCGHHNKILARYCNACGSKLGERFYSFDSRGRPDVYISIAHPTKDYCREEMTDTAVKAYRQVLKSQHAPVSVDAV